MYDRFRSKTAGTCVSYLKRSEQLDKAIVRG